MTSHIKLPVPSLPMDDVVKELKCGNCSCKYANVSEYWIQATGFAIDDFHHSILDEAFPTTPVVIRGGAAHSVYLNSEAMRRAGYEPQEPDTQGSWYDRDAEGKLTGHMAETGMNKTFTTIPKPPVAHAQRIFVEAQAALHRAGVTSCQEAASNTLLLQALRGLETEGKFKLDIFTHLAHPIPWIAEEIEASSQRLLDDAASYVTNLHMYIRAMLRFYSMAYQSLRITHMPHLAQMGKWINRSSSCSMSKKLYKTMMLEV